MTTEILGDGNVDPEPLAAMRERGGTWYAYQNVDLSSSMLGHLAFLKAGPGCTYEAPPEKYPSDTPTIRGWQYALVGTVDLDAGTVTPCT
jgi:hypothetical protein